MSHIVVRILVAVLVVLLLTGGACFFVGIDPVRGGE